MGQANTPSFSSNSVSGLLCLTITALITLPFITTTTVSESGYKPKVPRIYPVITIVEIPHPFQLKTDGVILICFHT